MKNAHTRLSRLELSIKRAAPEVDWTATPAYLALSDEDRRALHSYVDRFHESGLQPFTVNELHDFERILMPLAQEEKGDAPRL